MNDHHITGLVHWHSPKQPDLLDDDGGGGAGDCFKCLVRGDPALTAAFCQSVDASKTGGELLYTLENERLDFHLVTSQCRYVLKASSLFDTAHADLVLFDPTKLAGPSDIDKLKNTVSLAVTLCPKSCQLFLVGVCQSEEQISRLQPHIAELICRDAFFSQLRIDIGLIPATQESFRGQAWKIFDQLDDVDDYEDSDDEESSVDPHDENTSSSSLHQRDDSPLYETGDCLIL